MAEGGSAGAAATPESWRALEFYSGIGGLRYSLERARVSATVVEAFDINDVANDVYQHNFGHRPFQGNIQTLTAADLDRYEAHMWLLSPPCQPYTRQGLQKGSADARALSFLTILELIPSMSKPPVMLFVENVVGFETSDTHSMMIDLLEKSDFVTQEFILSPLQFGVPYSRPRYYCLAKRKSLSFKHPQFNNKLLSTADLLVGDNGAKSSATFEGKASTDNEKFLQHCEPIERFLEYKYLGELAVNSHLSDFLVPQSLVERWGSAMDIVYPNSKRCCCFTKSYYRYVKGTGSLLSTGDQADNNDKFSSLKSRCLRYFTPREVANLHSFPASFQFPSEITLKQRYALLGNSLSVAVVASLLKYLFEDSRSYNQV